MNTGCREEVLKLHSQGMQNNKIAKELCVSRCRVGQILRKYCPNYVNKIGRPKK